MDRGIPRRLNLLLAGGFMALGLASYLVVPLLLSHSSLWGLALLLPVALTTTNWALIHEGIHSALHPDRRINDRLARALGVLFGGAFQVLRFGHLLHHMFNRTDLDRTEVFDPAHHNRLVFGAGYYLRLNAGLYAAEVVGSIAMLLPRRLLESALAGFFAGDDRDTRKARDFARRQLLAPASLRAIRSDALLLLGLLGASLVLYGEHAWMLGLMLLGRGFMVSVVDNSFHYGTPLDDVRYARNLGLPVVLERLILNFNLHRVHHHQAGLSWAALPAAFAAGGERYDVGFAAAVARQFRGPIPVSRLPAAGPR